MVAARHRRYANEVLYDTTIMGGLWLDPSCVFDLPPSSPAETRSTLHPRAGCVIARRKTLIPSPTCLLTDTRLADKSHSSTKIFMTIRLRGPKLLDGDLRRATRALRRRHPMLRCYLIRTGPYADKFELIEDEEIVYPVKILPRNQGDETIRNFFKSEGEKTRLRVNNGPISPHTVWMFGPEDDDSGVFDIALDFQHYCIDGSSLKLIIHEFLTYALEKKNMSEEELEAAVPYGPWPVPQEVYLDEELAKIPFFQRRWEATKALAIVIYRAFNEHFPHLPRDDSMNKEDYSKLNSTMCLLEVLSETETTELLKKCRENKVSVTAICASAYLQACAEVVYEHMPIRRPFQAQLCIVGDSRTMASVAAPEEDMTPHVYAFPGFQSKMQTWEADKSNAWEMAKEIREFIVDVSSRAIFAKLYARLITFFLSHQPTNQFCPILNVSSWCAKSSVKAEYGEYKVEGLELLQNMSSHSWINLSAYSFLGKLHLSVYAPVPRFNKEDVEQVSKRGASKLRALIKQ